MIYVEFTGRKIHGNLPSLLASTIFGLQTDKRYIIKTETSR